MSDRFFTVEGMDGSGKSTFCKLMGQFLNDNGRPTVVVESYPRDGSAEFLRELWIHQRIPDTAVLSCILTLRKRVLVEQIIPALLEGKTVISDRWNDTTWVYQCLTLGIPVDVMKAMFAYHLNIQEILSPLSAQKQKFLFGHLKMYSTFFLDVDLEHSRARVGERTAPKDAFEKSDDEFFHRLRRNFLEHFNQRSYYSDGPLYTINANNDRDYVQLRGIDVMKNYLK